MFYRSLLRRQWTPLANGCQVPLPVFKLQRRRLRESLDWCWPLYFAGSLRPAAGYVEYRLPQTRWQKDICFLPSARISWCWDCALRISSPVFNPLPHRNIIRELQTRCLLCLLSAAMDWTHQHPGCACPWKPAIAVSSNYLSIVCYWLTFCS